MDPLTGRRSLDRQSYRNCRISPRCYVGRLRSKRPLLRSVGSSFSDHVGWHGAIASDGQSRRPMLAR